MSSCMGPVGGPPSPAPVAPGWGGIPLGVTHLINIPFTMCFWYFSTFSYDFHLFFELLLLNGALVLGEMANSPLHWNMENTS